MVGSCLVALLVHENFRGVQRAMYLLFGAYAVLAFYHLWIHLGRLASAG